MKRLFLRTGIILTLLTAYAGFLSAQTVSNDLLQTGTGTQEDLSSLGLGTVTFNGVPLSTDTGLADTIVQHPVISSTSGGTVNTQVIALHLVNSGDVFCNNQVLCGSFFNQRVEVHATINVMSATNGNISLPQPDALDPSVGMMTVFPPSGSTFTFNSSFSNIEADIIVVPLGAGVNATPIFTSKAPPAAMSASGGTMSMTAPSAYPNSTNFPTVAPYVIQLASPTAAFLASPVFHGSLWALGSLFAGLALWTGWRTLKKHHRLSLRPAYLAVFALALGLIAWKSPSYSHAQLVQDRNVPGGAFCPNCPKPSPTPTPIPICNPITAEQGMLIQHGVAPAQTQCQ